ncbi:MAG: GspE/PulE family protein, partial [Myxococcales bacterium]
MALEQTQEGMETGTTPGVTRERTMLVANAPAFLCGRPLGEILVQLGHVRPDKLEEALLLQNEKGGRIGEVLVGMKAATEEQVLQALGAQLDIAFVRDIRNDQIDLELVKKVPINFAKQAKVLPLALQGEVIPLVMNDPLDTTAIDHVRALVGAPVEARLATAEVLLDAINAAYDRASHEGGKMLQNLDEDENLDSLAQELEEPQDLLDSGDDEAPIIRLVNTLLKRAVKEKASDIHIEPYERDVCVRFRKDGVLHEIIRPPKRYQKAIASRVKIMGQLNIAETRLSQ